MCSTFLSPLHAVRQSAKEIIGGDRYIEIFVDTPLEECEKRDPKGLYKRAAEGNLPNLTGVGQEYEPPKGEAIELDGSAPVEENVETLVSTYFS